MQRFNPDRLTHVDESGQPSMVDVAGKSVSFRTATAVAEVVLPEHVAETLRTAGYVTPKGAVLSVARLAGVMGAKQTSSLIPLCHPLMIEGCDVSVTSAGNSLHVECKVSCTGKTGVEMEALTGATIAALTIYDMCKAMSHDIILHEVRLVSKRGGRSDVGDRT